MAVPVSKYIISLPFDTTPYVKHTFPQKGRDELELIQDCVGGFIQVYDKTNIAINAENKENPKWKLIESLLKNRYVKVYVNEEGRTECEISENIARRKYTSSFDRTLDIWGNVALVVSKKVIDNMGIDISMLNKDSDDESDGESEDSYHCHLCDDDVCEDRYVGCCNDGDCPDSCEEMCSNCATWIEESQVWLCINCNTIKELDNGVKAMEVKN